MMEKIYTMSALSRSSPFLSGFTSALLFFSALLWLVRNSMNGERGFYARCRSICTSSILAASMAFALPLMPQTGGGGISRVYSLIGSIVLFLSLLSFVLFLGMEQTKKCFPDWGLKQLLPLPLAALAAALLPLSALFPAEKALGIFSLGVCLLCLALIFLEYRFGPGKAKAAAGESGSGRLYFDLCCSAIVSLFFGLAFVLPSVSSGFFWPAFCMAYLFFYQLLSPLENSRAAFDMTSRIRVGRAIPAAPEAALPAPAPVVPPAAAAPAVEPAAAAPAAEPPAPAPAAKASVGDAQEAAAVLLEEETIVDDSLESINQSIDSQHAEILVAKGVTSETGTEGSLTVASFIPREFLSILNKNSFQDLKLGDHIKQEMTIFFSDIRKFTELSENLTPEESFAFINSYLSRIVPEITKNGGFVDKYIGDAIMALFPQVNGPDMAVRAAISIQEKIQEYNGHRANCGYKPLSMGIGIHTGTLMVGIVGTEDRMQSTVMSDAVNLASRVESLTKAFRVNLAISEETFKKLEDPGTYKYRFVAKVRVKGKSEPVSIFEIFDGINETLQKRKMEANRYFEEGMFNYYQKKYGDALKDFQKVREILPDDGAAAFYMDNCLARIKAVT